MLLAQVTDLATKELFVEGAFLLEFLINPWFIINCVENRNKIYTCLATFMFYSLLSALFLKHRSTITVIFIEIIPIILNNRNFLAEIVCISGRRLDWKVCVLIWKQSINSFARNLKSVSWKLAIFMAIEAIFKSWRLLKLIITWHV